jgi:hypothetical protein
MSGPVPAFAARLGGLPSGGTVRRCALFGQREAARWASGRPPDSAHDVRFRGLHDYQFMVEIRMPRPRNGWSEGLGWRVSHGLGGPPCRTREDGALVASEHDAGRRRWVAAIGGRLLREAPRTGAERERGFGRPRRWSTAAAAMRAVDRAYPPKEGSA